MSKYNKYSGRRFKRSSCGQWIRCRCYWSTRTICFNDYVNGCCKIFGLLTNIDAIKIKMPDSVPTGIARSFNILIPIFIIITAFSVGGCLFNTFTGNYLNVWIYNIIQLPLQALANTTGGILVLALANQLFWFLGIHGGMVIEGVRGPLSAAGLAENISAVQAGGVATNILTRGFGLVSLLLVEEELLYHY